MNKSLSQILEFNFYPTRYIHHSRYKEFTSENLFLTLKSNHRSEKKLSNYILYKTNLLDNYCFDFSEEYKRIAFIDGEKLNKLIFFIGLCSISGKIKTIISKPIILKIKEQLGEEAYIFSIKKAPFYIGKLKDIFKHEFKIDNINDFCLQIGFNYLCILLSFEPEAFTKRIIFKFPNFLDFKERINIDENLKKEIWVFIKKLLLKEISPEYSNLFCE